MIAGNGSRLVGDGRTPDTVRPRCPEALTVLDTTELRWFVHGPLPLDVLGWFAGSTGVAEERCDTYRLDGRCDQALKRRFGETLELKVRRSLDGRIVLGDGLAGPLEVWRRWSPADGLVEAGSDGPWVDVRKSIVKRRFSIDGTERAFSSKSPVTGAGCDVEVADVALGAVRGWSLAFAAFGPGATRRAALLASWQELGRHRECPEPFGPRTGRAMGYPAWLAHTTSSQLGDRRAQPTMTSSG